MTHRRPPGAQPANGSTRPARIVPGYPSPVDDAESAGRCGSVPEATVARLAIYLRVLGGLADKGTVTVSSEALAATCGINSAKLRKDLSHLGSYGTRGVGYEVATLVEQLSRTLGLAKHRSVAIVGVGNLGNALAGYAGFSSRGFVVAALLDADPSRIGTTIAGLRVHDVAELATIVPERDVSIGIIATPSEAAQSVCDELIAAGVTSVLNFAPVVLTVPRGVDVRKVDLAVELQILSFHEQRKAGDSSTAAATAATAADRAAATAADPAAAAALLHGRAGALPAGRRGAP